MLQFMRCLITGMIVRPAALMLRELRPSTPVDDVHLKSLINVGASSKVISSNSNRDGLAGSKLGLTSLEGIWEASLVPTLAKIH